MSELYSPKCHEGCPVLAEQAAVQLSMDTLTIAYPFFEQFDNETRKINQAILEEGDPVPKTLEEQIYIQYTAITLQHMVDTLSPDSTRKYDKDQIRQDAIAETRASMIAIVFDEVNRGVISYPEAEEQAAIIEQTDKFIKERETRGYPRLEKMKADIASAVEHLDVVYLPPFQFLNQNGELIYAFTSTEDMMLKIESLGTQLSMIQEKLASPSPCTGPEYRFSLKALRRQYKCSAT